MKSVGLIRKIGQIFDRKQKIDLVILGVLIFIGGILETLGVSGLIPVITAILDPDGLREIIQNYKILGDICNFFNIDASNTREITICLILGLMLIYVVKNVFILFLLYKQNTFITHAKNTMISRVLRVFLNRPYEDYLGADIPTVFRLTDSDIPQTFSLIMALLQLSSEVVVSGLIFIVLLLQSPSLTLFVLFVFGSMTLFITKVLKPKLNKIGKKNQDIQSRIARWRLQAIYGLKDVKVLNREEFYIRNYYESGKIGANVSRNYALLNNTPRLLIETVFIVAVLGYVAVYVTGAGDISVMLTTLSTFAIAAMRMLPSVNRINTYIAEIAYTQPSFEYLYENIQEGMKVDEAIAARKASSQKEKIVLNDKIELKNITFRYPDTDKNIFTNAEMVIPKGKSVGIMGASGAGKSTIVDILLGLLRAQEGEITCDGVDIFKNYESWLSQIGYIPQSIYLVDETIRENIALGIDEDCIDEERLWQVLEEAQLKEFVESLPEGLDTTIGDRGVRLSGGQRQRIGIARALYHNPEILVFDEATSALDNDTEAAVMDAINSFHGKKTMVIIAHRLNTIAKCDKIYKVEAEKLIESHL